VLLLVLFLVVANALPSCQTYCSEIQQWCNGTNAQFYPPSALSSDFCELVCPTYITTGVNTSWDSYDCRYTHLLYIIDDGDDPVVHCPHAGTSGGNKCGDLCNYYCDLVANACNGSNTIFMNKAACLMECYAYPSDSQANFYTVPSSMDSSQCRVYHATAALASAGTPSNVQLHCGHANASGGEGTCGTGCQNYCDGIMLYCNQSNQQFKTVSDCMNACGSYKHDWSGNASYPVTLGNSFECRKYHLIQGALTGLVNVHCPHAGQSGGSVCVSLSGASDLVPLWALSIFLPLLYLLL